MKKLVAFCGFFLLLLALPTVVFGKSKEFNPYDMVSSDGEAISYSEVKSIAEKNKSKLPSKMTEGNGEKFKTEDFNKLVSKMKPEKPFSKNSLSSQFSLSEVIGSDGRTKVSNTDVSPYKMFTYFYGENDKYGYSCTGNVIGKDLIVTNAHCIYDWDRKLYVKYAFTIPGLNNSYYSYGAYEMDKYFVPQGYIKTGSSDYDFAVVKLEPTPGRHIGDVVGTLPTKEVTNIKGTSISITGYPGDLNDRDGSVSQYRMAGKVSDETQSIAFYSIDTYHGQSGSALFNTSGQIIGVHNASYSGGIGDSINGGPKMTKPFRDFIAFALTQ